MPPSIVVREQSSLTGFTKKKTHPIIFFISMTGFIQKGIILKFPQPAESAYFFEKFEFLSYIISLTSRSLFFL